MYINSIGICIKIGLVICYADDTALMFYAKSWEEVEDKVANGLKEI